MPSAASAQKAGLFHFVMIKPTHYDDDGYPIQWLRSAIPSNTLACLNALAQDAARREVLGADVEMRLHTYDETNRRVKPQQIIRMIRRAGGRALIGLVGVQSNQFPRAVDLARPFLAAGLPVCIGGFHVSGCIAMLPELPDDIKAAQAMGISLFAGEAEEFRLDEVLRDAFNGALKPLYNYMDDLPQLAGEPPPFLPKKHVSRTSGSLSSIDLGRGCPYQCSFCTIINVQGRKSRIRSADDLERSCARTTPKASSASSSPTTTSPASAASRHDSWMNRILTWREAPPSAMGSGRFSRRGAEFRPRVSPASSAPSCSGRAHGTTPREQPLSLCLGERGPS